MSQDFEHRPVMVDEVVDLFGSVPPGVLLDATAGGAGHARALLGAHPQITVVALDRDPDAVAAATEALAPFAERATVVHARFDKLAEVLAERGITSLSGAFFDLGVSSPQLDRPERGFSYHHEAPLDMRMDTTAPKTAADVVNTWDRDALARLFAQHGEGRFARRIAQRIVAARPLSTTTQLADVVKEAIPAATRRTGGHPARRVFQAVRVAVNDELDILAETIDTALALLAPGGRLAVLAYHSGEDRIVKDRLRQAETGGCICPPGLPCVCGATPQVRLLWRGAHKPSAAEIADNRRAESARLRAVEKLPPDHTTDVAAE
ncbi:MAG: rRNA (cytosine1402-N4)-methyltransferase, partial [Actinomycetota bacterium]|nr:rRNA (cytosine1402-N4)-methyltransferase [Actinomycetota bacterium]